MNTTTAFLSQPESTVKDVRMWSALSLTEFEAAIRYLDGLTLLDVALAFQQKVQVATTALTTMPDEAGNNFIRLYWNDRIEEANAYLGLCRTEANQRDLNRI